MLHYVVDACFALADLKKKSYFTKMCQDKKSMHYHRFNKYEELGSKSYFYDRFLTRKTEGQRGSLSLQRRPVNVCIALFRCFSKPALLHQIRLNPTTWKTGSVWGSQTPGKNRAKWWKSPQVTGRFHNGRNWKRPWKKNTHEEAADSNSLFFKVK